MNVIHKPADRLIVAADFQPTDGTGRAGVRKMVLDLADTLSGTDVYLKVNSALRSCGYDLVDEIHSRGLRVFADLKLFDIGETLTTDGAILQEVRPELLTVSCGVGVTAMKALKAVLPATEVLGVTYLTSLTEADAWAMSTCSIESVVRRFARMGYDAKIDGLISAPREVAMLRKTYGHVLTLNTPAIRPEWASVSGDDQNPERIMTPAKAIRAGADRIVVGRPITGSKHPYDAVMRTLEEIASVIHHS